MTRPNSSVSYVLRFPSSSFSFSIKEARNSLSRFSISSSVHLSIIKSKCKETETLNQTLKGFPTLNTPDLYTEPYPSSPFLFWSPFRVFVLRRPACFRKPLINICFPPAADRPRENEERRKIDNINSRGNTVETTFQMEDQLMRIGQTRLLNNGVQPCVFQDTNVV
jgi:hypothetical protein